MENQESMGQLHEATKSQRRNLPCVCRLSQPWKSKPGCLELRSERGESPGLQFPQVMVSSCYCFIVIKPSTHNRCVCFFSRIKDDS